MDLTLIYPHQLFAEHPCLQHDRHVALIEDPLFFGTDSRWPMQVHRQRALLHRSSLIVYAKALRAQGLTVLHRRHYEARNTQDHLQALHDLGYRRFHVADPVDDVLSTRLRRFADTHNCDVSVASTPMLLTPDSVLTEHFASDKKLRNPSPPLPASTPASNSIRTDSTAQLAEHPDQNNLRPFNFRR